MNDPGSVPWGLVAAFDTPERLLDAARRAHADGWRGVQAHAPYPVEGLAEALGDGRSRVPLATLLAALFGAAAGYALQWYSATHAYPIDVGGRPAHSWPMFVPVAFECAVLCGAIGAVAAFAVGSRLPALQHPLDAAPGFDRVTRDRFVLAVRAGPQAADVDRLRHWLDALAPLSVHVVEQS